MTLRLGRIALVTCCFIAVTALMAAQPAATDTVTVGDFVVRLADALNPAGREITTLDQAQQFFSGRGASIPSSLDLSAPLTQMDVTLVTSLLGLKVEALEPGQAFTAESVDGFIGYLREESLNGRLATGGRGNPTLTISGLGACCYGTTCVQDQPSPCHNTGGIYKGKGVPCDPNPCMPGMGVCCIGRKCSITYYYDCPGIWTGKDRCHPPGSVCKNPMPATPSEP